MLTGIVTAVAVLGGLGAGLGLLLAAADRVFAVEEDPRLRRLVDALPGANCGGCGFPGCAAYAAAVLEGSTVVGGLPCGGRGLRRQDGPDHGRGEAQSQGAAGGAGALYRRR